MGSGLAFSDEGALTGVLQADLERTTDTPVAFFATSTAGWSGGSVQRLEIRFTAQADPVDPEPKIHRVDPESGSTLRLL